MPQTPGDFHWVSTWAASAQGAYPIGSAIAQPDLSAALPDAALGLIDQSLRMVFRPSVWSMRMRLRFSNVFGDRPLKLRGLRLALHLGGGACAVGTSVHLPDQTIEAGASAWTPPLELPWVQVDAAELMFRKSLAVSGWVEGASGPVTWHAKSMATSYLSAPGDRRAASDDGESRFPHTTTSTFFIDAADAWLPETSETLVGFGDSLTDGTATTLNGQDRWTDVLLRKLWAAGRRDLAVVNAGIGGNQVLGPKPQAGPWRGGPAAVERLERDVLSLSGVKTVCWLQGINDFSDNGNAEAAAVIDAMALATRRIQARGIRVIGATVPSALGSDRDGQGSVVQDVRRKAFNTAVRSGQVFEHFADLDAALTDGQTGRLRDAFNSDSTLGEPGDGIHPNRAGHACMAAHFFQALNR